MKKESQETRINNAIENALKNLKSLIDVNTVVGAPIKSENNDTIIPISKVTLGVLTGGGEYGKINLFRKGEDLPYSAGNGAIISIKPCGFLIRDENSDYKILSANGNNYESLLDKISNCIGELTNVHPEE